MNPRHYTNTSPPVVYRNLVILGNGVGDRLSYRGDPPGDVRAFDARTGKQVWRFNTVPEPGETGHDTWGGDSWKTAGHTNVWAPMSLDESRGLLYLPVSTPSNDFYGGDRPGANLFGESLVCLDAATGRLRWHFQIVHHGLWDYDPASAPNLVTITVGGRRIDAVVQLTKQGYAFVFDRVSGRPVWPIEERPVPASTVTGERAWPTQPVPTKPVPFSPQGASPDDVLDYTPELKAAAQAELKKYGLGPLYTPPSVDGVIMRPGIIGGANWGGAAFDAASGVLFFKTSHQAAVARIVPPDRSASNPRASEVDANLIGAVGNAPTFTPPLPAGAAPGAKVPSLPIFKPPYGEIVAMDLNRGEILWRSPVGDSPAIRNHPSLKDVTLPDRLGRRRRSRRHRHRRRSGARRRRGHGSQCLRHADGRSARAGRALAADVGHTDDLPHAVGSADRRRRDRRRPRRRARRAGGQIATAEPVGPRRPRNAAGPAPAFSSFLVRSPAKSPDPVSGPMARLVGRSRGPPVSDEETTL